MTGKLIAFPADPGSTTDEPSTTSRSRPQRASLASEFRPLRRARTEREEGVLAELPREATVTTLRAERRVEPATATRRDAPTMGERLRTAPAASPDSLRELIREAAPLAPDDRTTRRPAIRVLVGGQVRFVGWV